MGPNGFFGDVDRNGMRKYARKAEKVGRVLARPDGRVRRSPRRLRECQRTTPDVGLCPAPLRRASVLPRFVTSRPTVWPTAEAWSCCKCVVGEDMRAWASGYGIRLSPFIAPSDLAPRLWDRLWVADAYSYVLVCVGTWWYVEEVERIRAYRA